MKLSLDQILIAAEVATSLFAAADHQFLWAAYFAFYTADKCAALHKEHMNKNDKPGKLPRP